MFLATNADVRVLIVAFLGKDKRGKLTHKIPEHNKGELQWNMTSKAKAKKSTRAIWWHSSCRREVPRVITVHHADQ